METNTTTSTLLYLTEQPDWSAGLRAELSCHVSVFESHNGTEQRVVRRSAGRRIQEQTVSALSPAEAATRHMRNLQELQTKTAFPIWTHGRTATWSSPTATLEAGLPPEQLSIEVGDMVYLDDGIDTGFYTVASIASQGITLTASPDSFKAFTDPIVYPVRVGIRKDGESMMSQPNNAQYSEEITMEEL